MFFMSKRSDPGSDLAPDPTIQKDPNLTTTLNIFTLNNSKNCTWLSKVQSQVPTRCVQWSTSCLASVPPPPGSGGRGTLAGERGVWRVPIPTRGHTLWYSLYVRTLCCN